MESYFITVDSNTNGLAGRRYESIKEAILDGSWDPWDDGKIARCFAFGNGTRKDFERYRKDNKMRIVRNSHFWAIIRKYAPETENTCMNFINQILHRN